MVIQIGASIRVERFRQEIGVRHFLQARNGSFVPRIREVRDGIGQKIFTAAEREQVAHDVGSVRN